MWLNIHSTPVSEIPKSFPVTHNQFRQYLPITTNTAITSLSSWHTLDYFQQQITAYRCAGPLRYISERKGLWWFSSHYLSACDSSSRGRYWLLWPSTGSFNTKLQTTDRALECNRSHQQQRVESKRWADGEMSQMQQRGGSLISSIWCRVAFWSQGSMFRLSCHYVLKYRSNAEWNIP